jgi:hypothetical protein
VKVLALRLSLVTSNIAPLVEVTGDVGGSLVRPDDAETLAEGLLSVFAGAASNDAWRNNEEKRSKKTFTAEAACDGLGDFYETTINGSRGSVDE